MAAVYDDYAMKKQKKHINIYYITICTRFLKLLEPKKENIVYIRSHNCIRDIFNSHSLNFLSSIIYSSVQTFVLQETLMMM